MKILVVAHKLVDFPKITNYFPFFVGPESYQLSSRVNGSLADGSGLNIASKNENYSELTAQYWLWKNSQDNIKGLVHYRRYLLAANHHILNGQQIRDILDFSDVIVGHKIILPETLKENYEKYFVAGDFKILRTVMKEVFPNYLISFDTVMSQNAFHPMNILITRKEIFDSYSKWLFEILFEVEKEIGSVADRDPYQQRVFGFMSERLLDVWILKNGIKTYNANILQTNHPNWHHNLFVNKLEYVLMRSGKAKEKLIRILSK